MATATLTTITPVHVGSGQKLLRDFDFVVKDGKVGFIDLEKVVSIIGIEHIAQFTSEIEKKSSIMDYLRNGRGLKNILLEDICSRICVNRASSSRANELKEQYHSSLKGACIPGSSLKGSIKTALWERASTSDFLQSLKVDDFKNRKGKWDSENIDKKLFGENPNEKSTRFLKVGDVHFNSPKTGIYEIGIFNKFSNSWGFKDGQFFLAECLPIGLTGKFEIIIDRDWFNKNKKHYPHKWNTSTTTFLGRENSQILKELNAYTLDQLDTEIKELENENFDRQIEGNEMLNNLDKILRLGEEIQNTNEPSAIIRLGGNSGWTFMTGGWIKNVPESVLDERNYNSIRKIIQRNKDYPNMALWPKTRKMTTSGFPLGFVKISLSDTN